jgi:hypothetical protein
MLIKIYKLILLFSFTLLIANGNILYSQKKSSNYLDGYVFSLKAGYHDEDKTVNIDNIPKGFSADGSLEYHTGKNWYIGVNFDLSFGSDEYANEQRSIVVSSYSPVVKYRYFFKYADMYIGMGAGASQVTINGNNTDNMLNLNVRAGFEFRLNKRFLASVEGVYNQMIERKSDGGRTNDMFMMKAGLGYLFMDIK